jgi:hypothetical protein
MPVDISSIPSNDREDFQRRLRTYDLDVSSVQEPLSVTARTVLAYGPGRESARTPHVIQTTDLAKVKRMVGVDDRVFRNIAPGTALPGRVALGTRPVAGRATVARDVDTRQFKAGPGLPLDDATGVPDVSDDLLRQMDDDDVNNVRLAARSFVRGDTRLVASFSPLFPRVIGTVIVPVWPLLSVTVASGSVLEFGPGVHALVAYQVTVEEGGRIVSRGHLTVNCTVFRKPGRSRPFTTVGALTGGFRPIFSQ